MQGSVSEKLSKFIVKYIWILCAALIIAECVSSLYAATVLMKRSAQGTMQATSGEMSNRVDSTLNLLTGLSHSQYTADLSLPIFDRAVALLPLQESNKLFMLAVTDEEGFVSSADETERLPNPKEGYNLMSRDYMQRLYATGEYQITDPIVAGSDGKTVNYTIAVPILQDGEVKGSVFGSIYFDEIQGILNRNPEDTSKSVYLFGREGTLISADDTLAVGTSIQDLWEDSISFGTTLDEIQTNMQQQKDGSYWVLDQDGLHYILYCNIAPAPWTLFYCTNFFTMLLPLLPMTLLKIVFFIVLCLTVSVFSKRYVKRSLAAVTQLLSKMSNMQLQLFQTDSSDYASLLDISREGLVDQLTGLSTRTLFFSKMCDWPFDQQDGAVIFIDLDNLKQINDAYGHDAGDAAILFIGRVLKQFDEKYKAISARYGGDEFVLIMQTGSGENISTICENLSRQMDGEIEMNGARVRVHASMGVALYPHNGTRPEDLICKADLALYESKRRGRGSWTLYEDTQAAQV